MDRDPKQSDPGAWKFRLILLASPVIVPLVLHFILRVPLYIICGIAAAFIACGLVFGVGFGLTIAKFNIRKIDDEFGMQLCIGAIGCIIALTCLAMAWFHLSRAENAWGW